MNKSSSHEELPEKASIKKISDKLRHIAPLDFQCQVFCGGKKCKYEGSSYWTETQMALDGVFSSWITCNILAMARPNTEQIEKHDLIGQFHKNGIRTIINLQQAGEHAYCGNGLQPGGFSYNSTAFMEKGIFFYNFPWKDYGVASLDSITDVMKVMAFSLVDGKVAVHCHAGLGRTGVVIACYLVYSCRITGNDAIRYVRVRRPNSIQTRIQVTAVRDFEKFIWPSFFVINVGEYDDEDEFTLDEHLRRQAKVHHGLEARNYRYLPKIVHQVCERLLQLAALQPIAINVASRSETRSLMWKNFIGMRSVSSPLTPLSSKESSKFSFENGHSSNSAKKSDSNSPDQKSKKQKKVNKLRLKQKGKSVIKSISKAFKLGKSSKIDEEEIVEKSATTSAQSSKRSSYGSNSSCLADILSLDGDDDNNDDDDDDDDDRASVSSTPETRRSKLVAAKFLFPSADSLMLIDEDEPCARWGRWKKRLLGDEGEEEDQTRISPDDLENMERMVSQQSSLVFSEDGNEDMDLEAMFTATLPNEVVKPVPPKRPTTANQIVTALTTNPDELSQETLQKIEELARTLNDNAQRGWNLLASITDPIILVGLLYIWLEQLQQPVLSKQEWMRIQSTDYKHDPAQSLQKLSKSSRITLEYLLRFVAHIEPLSAKQQNQVLTSLTVVLMQVQAGAKGEFDETISFANAVINLIQKEN